MKTKLLNFWETLRSSYWFLPSLMMGLAIGLSLATIELDKVIGYGPPEELGWIYAGGPEGARALLSTVAGSMITVAGVTFSITVVALTLASSQFGPRLLNSFMRDTGNQVVLGTFIATFLYCLLVLRTIRNTTEGVFVPHISITFGLLLAIASLGVLIYFIHHASASIHVESVIAAVDRDLDDAIERLFPKQRTDYIFELALRHEDDVPEDFEQKARPVSAGHGGYLQAIDHDGLMKIAMENDLLLGLEYRSGDFVAQGNDLVMVWPGESLTEEIAEKINNAFIFGARRLHRQDVEFAMSQLVEIAVRALSPGINDPFTAMACIDRLGAALSHLAERRIPSAYRYDDDNQLRLIADSITFAGLADTAFNQIRQYGRSSAAVTIRLLETIAVIAARTTHEDERAALLRHALMITRGGMEALPEERDREDIEERYQIVLEALRRP
jgi:uncharacterized membrane protein